MKLQIERVRNGFILTSSEGKDVFTEGESELLTLQSLLWSILENIGYFGSKHDEERLFVEIRKQKK